jgi:deoxyadenosine/deoxycytidine kinase
MYRYVAIEGNIGAGKTTIAENLARHLACTLVLEEFSDNPFLPLFYKQPERYAFPLEVSFLSARYDQLKQVDHTDRVVSDYWLTKTLIFAHNNLSAVELSLFWRIYEVFNGGLVQPDLVIYFDTPVSMLQDRIKKRGRDYEQNIKDNYLLGISALYEEFLKKETRIPIVIVDNAELNMMETDVVLSLILEVLKGSYEPGINRLKP